MSSAVAPRLPSHRLLGHARSLRQDALGTLLRAMREGGDAARLRLGFRDILVVSSPALAQEVLVEKAALFRKSRGLRVFARPITGTGLLVSEDPVHRRRRAVVAPAFGPNRLSAYADAIVTETDRWLASVRGAGSIDLSAEMARLTLHIVSSTLFHTQVAADVARVGRAFEAGSRAVMALVRAPIPWPEALPSRQRRIVEDSAHSLDEIVFRIIRERRASGSDPGDVLSRLLAARDPDTGEALDDQALRDEVMTLFLAGHETTANAFTWSLALLARNPGVAEEMAHEVERVLRGRAPGHADLPALPYTLAVFKEAMRLYPPAYLVTRSSLGPVSIGGFEVGKDTLVFVNIYGIQRRPELFAEPERFMPERFLDGAEKRWPRGAFLPFGAGPRICAGNHFALMEGQLVLARLAQELTLSDAVGALAQPLPLITLRPKQPMQMRLVWRGGRSARQSSSPSSTTPS